MPVATRLCFIPAMHRLTKPFPKRILACVAPALLAGALALGPARPAAAPFSPILVETTGSGPKEKVTRFKVNPLARFHRLDRQLPLMAPIDAAIAAGQESGQALQDKLEEQAFRQGLGIFSIGVGVTGAAVTALEQGYVDDLFPTAAGRVLPKLGSALNYLGLALSVYQLAIGPATGDGRAEIVNAYKGVSGFLIGRFGTPGMQLAMIAALPIDISLSYFGDAAWSAREDAWRQSYRKYYREMTAARDRYATAQEIRARSEGGRTKAEWKRLLSWYLDNITKPERFKNVIETEVRNYVQLFWSSPRFPEYAADVDQAIVGYARGASLTQAIKDKLEAEHRSVIMAMLIRDVLPELARERWLEGLAEQVEKLNDEARPELNAPLTLEVSAYGLKQPTKFHMLLEDDKTWTGTLRPGEPLRIRLTKLAWFKAGFPDTLRLDAPEGAVERRFTFEQDEALVVFGQPGVSGLISDVGRKEGVQDCVITRQGGGKPTRQERVTRPARPGTALHTAITPGGYLLLGRFDGSGWTAASPGRILGSRRLADTAGPTLGQGDLIFAAPYFEGITALSDCRAEKVDTLHETLAPPYQCRIHRLHREKNTAGREIVTRCAADVALRLDGFWTELGGRRQYVPIDHEQLEHIGREYQNMLEGLQ